MKNIRTKLGLLITCSLLALGGGFGQCLGDFVQDAFIFRVVN
jgi:hypothetical protein